MVVVVVFSVSVQMKMGYSTIGAYRVAFVITGQFAIGSVYEELYMSLISSTSVALKMTR